MAQCRLFGQIDTFMSMTTATYATSGSAADYASLVGLFDS